MVPCSRLSQVPPTLTPSLLFSAFIPTRKALFARLVYGRFGSVRVGLVPPLSHHCSCRCSLRVNQPCFIDFCHLFLGFSLPLRVALSSHSFSPFLLFCSSQLSALSSHHSDTQTLRHSDTQHSAPSPRLSRTRAFVSLRRPTDVRQGDPLATPRTRAFFCSTAPSSASGSTGL